MIEAGKQYVFRHMSNPYDPDNGTILTVTGKVEDEFLDLDLVSWNTLTGDGRVGLVFEQELTPVEDMQ